MSNQRQIESMNLSDVREFRDRRRQFANKEALHLVLKLNTEDLDTQMAPQCASLLIGTKISDLLTVGRSKRMAVLELSRETAMSYCTLYESSKRITFPLYIRPTLEVYLSWPEVKVLMERFGYRGQDSEGILSFVSIEYEECTKDYAGFSHEIGSLLGYPAKDVTGFIGDSGKNFLYIGYWKVYSDLSGYKRIFQSYNHARKHIIHMVSRSVEIDVILRAHNPSQYESMTM